MSFALYKQEAETQTRQAMKAQGDGTKIFITHNTFTQTRADLAQI